MSLMKRGLSIGVLVCALLAFLPVFPQTFKLVHDGVEREYLVHLPSFYNGSAALPVVIALHGAGETPAFFETMTGLSVKSDASNFIAVYPRGIAFLSGYGNTAWNQDTTGVDDVGFLSAMLDSLSGRYRIDTTRVYVTGFSIGGGMCYRAAKALSRRIAAIAPVSPYVSVNYPGLLPSRPIPIVQFKSMDDDYAAILPITEYWVNLNNCAAASDTFLNQSNIVGEEWKSQGNRAEIVLYSPVSAGHAWIANVGGVSATDAMWEFFGRHSLSSSVPFAATVRILSPADGTVFDVPGAVAIRAEAAAPAGGIAKVEFYQSTGNRDEVKIGEADPASCEVAWLNDATGKYRIAAKALDAGGNVINPIQPVFIHAIRHSIADSGTAASSSSQSTSFRAQRAIDRNFKTRWMSQYRDPQWIRVDLGAVRSVEAVTLYWEASAYAKAYQIQVSTDTLNWADVHSTSDGNGGVDAVSFDPVRARYVRMLGTQRGNTASGYSLYEFLVHPGETDAVREAGAQPTPAGFTLFPNYPNPFNPSTTVAYSIRRKSFVTLILRDVTGRLVETLVNGNQEAGRHEIRVDAAGLASGNYLLRLTVDGTVKAGRLSVVK
jgi:polyhydroxybutyrate depolymerase